MPSPQSKTRAARARAARAKARAIEAVRLPAETGAASRYGASLSEELVARARARRHARRPGVEVGPGVRFGRGVRLVVPPGARIVLGRNVEIGDWTILEALPGGVLSIAEGALVARGCTIAAERHVSIGRDSGVAEWSSIRDHDHDPAYPVKSMRTLQADVRIGDRAWIGSRVTILRGASIGDDAIIGANAVVSHPVPAACVAVGVPARVVRENVRLPPA